MSHKDYKDIGSVEDIAIEEMGELLQAIGKAKRFGWFNYHPDRVSSNNLKEALDEAKDVLKAVRALEWALDEMYKADCKNPCRESIDRSMKILREASK